MKKIIFIFLFITIYLKLTNNIITKQEKNLVGTINITNTNINYNIYKSKDNNYYLNHNNKKQKDRLGSIFLDYRNNLDDKKLLIYGHNSKNLKNAYFKDLEKYKDYNFYKNNKYIQINLKNNKYLYKIFAINIVPNNDYHHTKIKFSKKEFLNYIEKLSKTSIYNTKTKVSLKDNIITLQTCNYNPDNTYLLINAKRVDNNEKIYI